MLSWRSTTFSGSSWRELQPYNKIYINYIHGFLWNQEMNTTYVFRECSKSIFVYVSIVSWLWNLARIVAQIDFYTAEKNPCQKIFKHER